MIIPWYYAPPPGDIHFPEGNLLEKIWKLALSHTPGPILLGGILRGENLHGVSQRTIHHQYPQRTVIGRSSHVYLSKIFHRLKTKNKQTQIAKDSRYEHTVLSFL